MRALFDQGVPVPLREHLARHTVDTADQRGWSTLSNCALLDHAEADGYQILITTDQNLRHQQALADRLLAIVVLLAASWPRIKERVADSRANVERTSPGRYIEEQV